MNNRTMPPLPPETEILLTPDQTEVAMKAARSIRSCVSTVAEYLNASAPLSSTLAFNTMFVAEHDLADLCKAIGIETDGRARVEHRSQELRQAYARIAELEAKLGTEVSTETAQLRINALSDQLKAWWKLEGFGFVSKVDFNGSGCCVTLSCMLSGRRIHSSATPVSDNDKFALWKQSLVDAGYKMANDRHEMAVVDCDQSRKVLSQLISKRMPSALITKFNNGGARRNEFMSLHSVELYVDDIQDFETLPTEDTAFDCSEMG